MNEENIQGKRPAAFSSKLTFLGQDYEPGMVYQYLESAKFDVTVGLDFGGKESVLFLNQVNAEGKRVNVPLQMQKSDGYQPVPTYLAYTDQGPVIGWPASYEPGFLQDFKVDPSRWEEQADRAGHTYGDLIRDYIHVLWSSMEELNPAVAAAKAEGRLQVAAGCPASRHWTETARREKLQKLVEEATGCSSVMIVAESTAAVMVPLFAANAEGSPSLDRGILLYDFGSTTANCTYVYMGDVLVSRSLRLGGNGIDAAMLHQFLLDNGLQMGDVPPGQYNSILAKLRKLKESFYSSGCHAVSDSIWFWKRDALGNGIPEEFEPGRNYTILVNKSFMERVLQMDQSQLTGTLPQEYQGLSWLQCMEKFLKDTAWLTKEYPRAGVILSGGTSFVAPVQTLAKHVYGEKLVYQESNPSLSVATGLCHGASLVARARPLLEASRNTACEKCQPLRAAYFKPMAGKLDELTWKHGQALLKTCLQDGQPHTMLEIMDRWTEKIRQDPELRPAVLAAFTGINQASQGVIVDAINQLSKDIYQVTLAPALPVPQVGDTTVQNMANQIDLAQILPEAVQVKALNALSEILSWVGIIMCMGGNILGGIPVLLGQGVDGLKNMMKDRMKKKVLSQRELEKLAEATLQENTMKKRSKKNQKRICSSMESSEELKKTLNELAEKQYEVALGKILFLVYETWNAD